MIVVSSTEPPAVQNPLRALFPEDEYSVSTAPERRGVDFLWRAKGEWHGVQRKELKDFLASHIDGRLTKEIGQMRDGVAVPHLVIEGRVSFVNDQLATGSKWGRPVTRAMWRGMTWSLAAQGVQIGYTSDAHDTAEYVAHLYTWSQKEKHGTGMTRPGPTGEWGTPTSRDFQLHLLQGLPGVGRELAERILDHFGGMPWGWRVTVKELTEVPGIGRKKAVAMWNALGGDK